jgi:hypothetical protein
MNLSHLLFLISFAALSGCMYAEAHKRGDDFDARGFSIGQRIELPDVEAEQTGPTTRRVKTTKGKVSPDVAEAIKALGEAVK